MLYAGSKAFERIPIKGAPYCAVEAVPLVTVVPLGVNGLPLSRISSIIFFLVIHTWSPWPHTRLPYATYSLSTCWIERRTVCSVRWPGSERASSAPNGEDERRALSILAKGLVMGSQITQCLYEIPGQTDEGREETHLVGLILKGLQSLQHWQLW